MSDEPADLADALATADAALEEALHAGDADAALRCADVRNQILSRIGEQALAGVESARLQLRGARAANDTFERVATAARERVAEELDAVQAQRRLGERVRPVVRGEPRFVSRRV